MDANRHKLIDRAKELNTSAFSVIETQERIREVCAEYVIEAKVDVDRLLAHPDWRVRWSALDIVWWGLGATDGIDHTIELLMHDPDVDIRAQAALALYEASRGSSKQTIAAEALRRVADDPDTEDYVRESAQTYLLKLSQAR
jgi:HEAT repeat protein